MQLGALWQSGRTHVCVGVGKGHSFYSLQNKKIFLMMPSHYPYKTLKHWTLVSLAYSCRQCQCDLILHLRGWGVGHILCVVSRIVVTRGILLNNKAIQGGREAGAGGAVAGGRGQHLWSNTGEHRWPLIGQLPSLSSALIGRHRCGVA